MTNKTEIETNIEDMSQNTEMLEQVQIKDTPFTAVRLEEKWFLTMGKYRLTETLQSLDECIEQSKDASWWRIMQIVNIMIEEHERNKKTAQI